MSEQTKIEKGYYPNGQLQHKIPYHQDQKHGIAKWWYESGQLEYETLYHQGQQHGMEKWWYKNGKIEYERYFLYNEEATKEEYRKHELVESLACLNNRK
ncbi:hypothetical protein LCGC14_2243450 [marine sediment metagenome]|uniref:MORN variant repeat protein n=1 Tax=marine sediment metagenome TaxID=412755 RepID=A0A0F9FH82_9ZZZZ